MGDSAAGEERLCWRPWPCAECSHGVTPIGYLVERLGPGSALSQGAFDLYVRKQVELLLDLVGSCTHQTDAFTSLPKIAEGSEHAVYLETSLSVIKLTLPGTYGESSYLNENGMIFQQSCWPLEYLIRMRLWEQLLGNAPVPLGITKSGQIVTRQDYITGELPTQTEVDAYLLQSGLEPVKQSRWLWKKNYADKGFAVWLGDARDDNFVLTNSGIVPIDVRMWFERPSLQGR
jgi:hypothetical protein